MLKCQECTATIPDHRWGKIRAHYAGWYFMLDSRVWCPEHRPEWAPAWPPKSQTGITRKDEPHMRINVYSQELTKEVSLTRKTADTGRTYYGVRIYLASPDILHHTADDDDRSAITFWIPHAQSFTPEDLASVFLEMAALTRRIGATNPG